MNVMPFSDRPLVVVWEMTRACRLACVHCRATAKPQRDPHELSTVEAKSLIDELASIAPKYFIMSGGDPSRRDDLLELVEYAANRGLKVALSPGATPDFLKLDLTTLRDAGLSCLSFSLDGATEATHNRFRGVPKAWEWTLRGMQAARQARLPFQINSVISATNLGEFDQLSALVEELDPANWTIFLLVPTGRGRMEELPSPAEVEKLFGKLCDLSRRVHFPISTTEGPHYRRVMLQKAKREGGQGLRPHVSGVNDGRGFVFVSHTGAVCPSGFLPLPAGNIRRSRLLDIYQKSPLFQALRNPGALKGKCGRCEFRAVCGGSRARAFAVTGDPFAEEPLCPYQPSLSSL